jgi:predicted hydrocarbon binding protein
MKAPSRQGEFVLPAATLTILRRALRKEAGALKATHALHAAGYAAGEGVAEDFAAFAGATRPETLADADFWSLLNDFFVRRGWGGIRHERVHPGMAILTSSNWVEADDEGRETQPGCAFSSGVLASLFSRLAGGPVAVLEVACRSRGDEACRFLFGAEEAVHEVYGHLLEGASLETALAQT